MDLDVSLNRKSQDLSGQFSKVQGTQRQVGAVSLPSESGNDESLEAANGINVRDGEKDDNDGDSSSEELPENTTEYLNGSSTAPKAKAAEQTTSAANESKKLENLKTDSEGSSEDDNESDDSSSDEASQSAVEWADKGDDDEVGGHSSSRNNCIFCGQDEEHDPSTEFEEYLSCAVCGDNAHSQCAREKNALSGEESSGWRCPSCVLNGLEMDPIPDAKNEDSSFLKEHASAPKLTRDLLPASARGSSRPGSHSMFNELIVKDDPLDGTRHLRKRKASMEGFEEQSPSKKRAVEPKIRQSVRIDSLTASDKPSVVDQATPVNNVNSSQGERSRPSRTRRPPKRDRRYIEVTARKSGSLILVFHIRPQELLDIASKRPRPRPQKKRDRGRQTAAENQAPYLMPTPYSATNYVTPFYSFNDRETDELKSKPYGGILNEADADTTKTIPLVVDVARFEEARQKAEEEWRSRAIAAEHQAPARKVSGPASKIQCISFGGFEIDTWYAAPYPEEYSRNRVLYICEFCLKYMNSVYVAWRHKLKCPAKHPPGDEIYRKASVSVFEVDGRKNPVYCQNLCLLAKLFLGSKTLYYDVEPFLFYVMTEYDELGCHFVGYFSKEKRPSSQNNVSCILTLPIHQRKGYGNLLIDFSYLLTRVERKTGSPEKPLSDMGLVSYRNYWRLVLCYALVNQEKNSKISITELGYRTGMTADDIVCALEGLRALVRDPVTGTYALRLDYDWYKDYIGKWEAKGYVRLDPEALVWTPFILGRSNHAQWNQAPALTTVAPREESEEPNEKVDSNAEQATALEEAAKHLVNGNHSPKNNDANSSVVHPDAQDEMSGQQPTSTLQNGVLPEPVQSTITLIPAAAKPAVASSYGQFAVSTPRSTASALPDIPPSRFELFPPLTSFATGGSASRRKSGRSGMASSHKRRKTGVIGGGRRRDRVKEAQRARERKLQRELEKERARLEAIQMAGSGQPADSRENAGEGEGEDDEAEDVADAQGEGNEVFGETSDEDSALSSAAVGRSRGKAAVVATTKQIQVEESEEEEAASTSEGSSPSGDEEEEDEEDEDEDEDESGEESSEEGGSGEDEQGSSSEGDEDDEGEDESVEDAAGTMVVEGDESSIEEDEDEVSVVQEPASAI